MRTATFMATLEAYQKKNPEPYAAATMESIAFQKNDPFGAKLESIIDRYKILIDAGASRKVIKESKDIHKDIIDAVKSRLGIKISLHTDSYLAATIPNIYIPHNAMVKDDIRWIFEDYDDIGGQKVLKKAPHLQNLGTVNTETAKVSGWFSEQEVPVFMNMYDLFKSLKMTSAEVTAVLLHELGHDFNGILFSSAVNTTNQVIADIIKHISDSDRGGDVNYIYHKAKKIDPKVEKDIAVGLASGNKVVMNIALYRLLVGSTETLMHNHIYDRTSYEALSDNFTSKFGYGFALVTGLEKLEDMYPEYEASRNMTVDAVILLAHTGAAIIAGFVALAKGLVLAAPIILLMGLLSAIIINSFRPSSKDMTYDNIRDRYIRIRNQLIEVIKDAELPIETRKTLLIQIEATDIIISSKKVYNPMLTQLFSKYNVKDQRVIRSIALQQDIEKMLANDIFVAANKLALKA